MSHQIERKELSVMFFIVALLLKLEYISVLGFRRLLQILTEKYVILAHENQTIQNGQ